jgi:hypothetical protein
MSQRNNSNKNKRIRNEPFSQVGNTKSSDDEDEEKAEKELVADMLSKFIIPNWYKPAHFEKMEGWDEEKVEAFKDYLKRCVCVHDEIRDYIEEVLENFINEKDNE